MNSKTQNQSNRPDNNIHVMMHERNARTIFKEAYRHVRAGWVYSQCDLSSDWSGRVWRKLEQSKTILKKYYLLRYPDRFKSLFSIKTDVPQEPWVSKVRGLQKYFETSPKENTSLNREQKEQKLLELVQDMQKHLTKMKHFF